MPNSHSPTPHSIALRLSSRQDQHLEERAAYWLTSKASYIRRLLQEDLDRLQQGPSAGQG